MKIDAHQHFWQYNPEKHAWIEDHMSTIRQDFLPKDLKPLLDQAGVEGTVAVQADESFDENTFLLQLAKENSFIKKVVGWVDLRSLSLEKSLEEYSTNPSMAGFRMILQGQPPALMDDISFRNGMAKLKNYGYTYDILVFPHHLRATLDLVSHFPDQPFVIDHLAKPYIKDGKIDEWASWMKKIASFDNVHCKVSGMVTEANWKSWTSAELNPYIEVVLEAFGAERLMFGSDWPVQLLAAEYQQYHDLLSDYISSLSAVEQANIMGNNAAKFYGIQ